jgi:Predicted metal binding domain
VAEPTLVDPAVSRTKFERQLELWDESAAVYRRRGWTMLARGELSVDVAFVGELPMGPFAIRDAKIPLVSACVRIDFANYDLWPPSVVFIDYLSGQPAYPPIGHAFLRGVSGQAQNVLVDPHPITGRPFFCVAGTREYHIHPQHNGDLWLVRRNSGEGTLARLCDLLWRGMVRSVIGMNVDLSLQVHPNADLLRAQMAAALQQQALQAAQH